MDGWLLSPVTSASIIGFLIVVLVAVVAKIGRLVQNGDWIPRVTHERETNRADHDANEWRAEGRIKDQAILVELGHIREEIEEIGHTLHNFIAAIQKLTDVPPGTTDDS